MSQRLPTTEYNALMRFVLKRDAWRCRHCNSRNNVNVHHIIFRSHQGPDESWNLAAICSSCHDGIHVAVHNGVFGLVILWDGPLPNADSPEGIRFQRNWNWKPQ